MFYKKLCFLLIIIVLSTGPTSTSTFAQNHNTKISLLSHTASADGISFSPDLKYLITTSSNNLYLTDLTGKAYIKELKNIYARTIIFNSSGSKFATGTGIDRSIKIWNYADFKPVKSVKLSDNTSRFALVQNTLIYTDDFSHLSFLDILTDSLKKWKCPFTPRAFAASNDSRYIVVYGYENLPDYRRKYQCNLYEYPSMNKIKAFNVEKLSDPAFVDKIAFARQGDYLAIAGKKDVYFYSLKEDDFVDDYSTSGKVESITFSQDGKYLAIGLQEPTIILYNVKKEKVEIYYSVANLDKEIVYNLIQRTDAKLAIPYFPEYQKRNQWISDITFSNDNSLIGFCCNKYAVIMPLELFIKK